MLSSYQILEQKIAGVQTDNEYTETDSGPETAALARRKIIVAIVVMFLRHGLYGLAVRHSIRNFRRRGKTVKRRRRRQRPLEAMRSFPDLIGRLGAATYALHHDVQEQ